MQTIMSSRKQIPGSFKKIPWQPGTTNLDIGAGRFPELLTEALRTKKVENTPYDPQNQDINYIPGSQYDTITMNNVLNVIKNKKDRMILISNALNYIGLKGTIYIQIYQGDRTNHPRKTRDGWQNNYPLQHYIDEIKGTYPSVTLTKEKGLICLKLSLPTR